MNLISMKNASVRTKIVASLLFSIVISIVVVQKIILKSIIVQFNLILMFSIRKVKFNNFIKIYIK